jgi:hypothetical protein
VAAALDQRFALTFEKVRMHHGADRTMNLLVDQ